MAVFFKAMWSYGIIRDNIMGEIGLGVSGLSA